MNAFAEQSCPICDGALCEVCHLTGRGDHVGCHVPASHEGRPWKFFTRLDLTLFLRRVYNAAPQASAQQVRDLVESLYLAAALGHDAGYEEGSAVEYGKAHPREARR